MGSDPKSLPTAAATSAGGLAEALESAPPLRLEQAWEQAPTAAATAVRIAWCPDAILVKAELEDADVHSSATADGERFWELGDLFEIFLEAQGEGFYTEMHVAPGNFRMHLKLRPDDRSAIKAGRLALQDVMVSPPGFQSLCRLAPGGWEVEALIPAVAVQPGGKISRASRWRASFCRYDAWSDGRAPVLSSTSPHSCPINFHDRADWRPICF